MTNAYIYLILIKAPMGTKCISISVEMTLFGF